MFVGREKELGQLFNVFDSVKKEIVLVFGKRRVGKTTLIQEAAKQFDGTVIFFEAIKAKPSVNIQRFCLEIANAYNEPVLPFANFKQAFLYLNGKPGKKLVLLDEYPDLKAFEMSETVDSSFREICDLLSENTKLVFAGSHLKMMKSLLEEDNPLFGRFTLTIKLEEFNYLEASLLYDEITEVRKKVEIYSVFGGLPYICSMINPLFSLRENIERLLIPENGQARLYLENVLNQELRSISAGETILSIIGNTKMRFSEIESRMGGNTNGGLARQLEYLLDTQIIRKVAPINKPNDKKKTYYEISNNLVRFYYTYLIPYQGRNRLISETEYYTAFIEPSILTFLSLRFEDVVHQFFIIKAKKGLIPGILNIGRYWYNNIREHKNGEFGCVLQRDSGYAVYEVKFYSSPLDQSLCDREAFKIREITDFNVSKIGFVSLNGFCFQSQDYDLVSGEMLFEI